MRARRTTDMSEYHASDEQLSEYLDASRGAGATQMDRAEGARSSSEVGQHVADCEVCCSRLGALREAMLLVGAPVGHVPETVKAAAVAAAIREGLGEEPAARDGGGAVPFAPLTRRERWYRSPRLLAGAAAAFVLLALGVSLAFFSQSSTRSPQSSAARAPTHGAASTLGRQGRTPAEPSAGGALNSAEGQSAGAASNSSAQGVPAGGQIAASVPQLGDVSSISQLVSELRELSADKTSTVPSYSTETGSGGTEASEYAGCVAATREAVHGGGFGPGLVARANYRGRDAIVTEFWPTMSAPPPGKTVVAVSTTSGCELLAHTST